MTDIAIIGKGPAGWSCAMTARMRGLSAVVVAPQNDTGLLRTAERIDNYPGMPQVSGVAMLESFRSQALSLGAEELDDMIKTQHGAQVDCHFCNKRYEFSENDLRTLLEAATIREDQ